jgi:hypothetical protein
MTCPRCTFENPPAMAFCRRCGARLATVCPSCGFTNPEGFAFCGKCGTRVAEAPAPPLQGSPAFTSPQSYTPKHFAERILTSKAALEGERKQVSVLFADLKGSMELLADRDPEDARRLLDPVLERMMEAVHRYEGTVNQVMGDGIMALFGAPLAHEDHAVRACYAALRMQESVKRYAEEVHRTAGVPLHIPVPPGLGRALPGYGRRRKGQGASDNRGHYVPRDGHELLAGEGGGGDPGVDIKIALIASLGLNPRKTRASGTSSGLADPKDVPTLAAAIGTGHRSS